MTRRTERRWFRATQIEGFNSARRRLGFEQLESRRVLAVGFDLVGSFDGLPGQAKSLNNPTSLEFGPDGRLYVSEQNGQINAFTIELQAGTYVATAHEELILANGHPVVQSIQNHNDDGSLSGETNRQVTGLVVAGTAENPVLYVSSSDPRIATNADSLLDTNSGVVTQVTWNGSDWESLDIIRGLPRSEENHSVNGMDLSADGTKLYVQVGGNTNNGAPSQFFAYTGEYALSGTLLEIDLLQIEQLPLLTDTSGGQNGMARSFVYDLPTLDDPTVPNDGVREDAHGMDGSGPWGGNDGFNMAVLPSDAPLRIYADGFRNQYDVVLTAAGQFFTIDNGSNANLGGDPITDESGAATQLPNSGGTGAAEPLFRIEDGGYYGHPNPTRANQDLAWVIYDDHGVADSSFTPNTVVDLSSLVPTGLSGKIPAGMLIDPSKFTGDATRLTESGFRIPYDDPNSPALVSLGTSTNGLTEYTADAFDGALQGTLVTAQFNGNITLLNLNSASDGIEPLVGPGGDGVLGTADDEVIDDDGIYPIFTGQSIPLDVTTGPDGTVWFTEFGPDNIRVIAPTDLVLPDDPDFDNDGLLNTVDPFIRDASNGGQLILPGQSYLWDFDANQDDNLPGPNGYGGGLTGVMVNGSVDYEQFFQAPSTIPGQIINLDNIKFTTAAGGGTTVVESVSDGDPTASQNDGEFLFHTGVTIAPTVETLNVRWTFFNPGDAFTGSSQQIGGYIGTGEQDNFLKIVATHDENGEILVSLEDADVPSDSYLQADDLFDVAEADSKRIAIDLLIDPSAETATPTIVYETATGESTVVGVPISLSGTAVLDAIRGNYVIEGQTTGLAVGLFSGNVGQPDSNTFQAVFDDIEISATGFLPTTLYRVNAGGPEVLATDSGPNWMEDTETNPSIYLDEVGDNRTTEYPTIIPGATVPDGVPEALFTTERDDKLGLPNMSWAFEAPVSGDYEVRLFLANGSLTSDEPGDRLFDVALEGQVLPNLDDVDPTAFFGHEVGGMITNVVTVTDGELNLEFLHNKKKPLINGIEVTLIPELFPGAAQLAVTVDVNAVQKSSFGPDSFQLSNTGKKRITRVDLDVTQALYADVVFDPFGVAGDTTSKPLQINTAGATGVVDPTSYSPYSGTGGIAGFKGLTLLFEPTVDSGFEPGETLGFSIDLDSNSIAGAEKSTLSAGTNPTWDVGGVSGAELIGSMFTVTFEDGSIATGQLQGAGNQAGSQGVASQDSPQLSPTLTVNGLSAGDAGTYDPSFPHVVVDGPAGQTARVVLTKGVLQPISNLFDEPYASQFDAQLAALAATDFPANNAARFQTVDVLLNGEPQDISSLFDFTSIPGVELVVDEDKVPLGFVASIIDPANNNLPLGPVTSPIYLKFANSNALPVAKDDQFSTTSDEALIGNLLADNGNGPDFDPDLDDILTVSAINDTHGIDQLVALSSGATVIVGADGLFTYDPNGAFAHLPEGQTEIDQFQYTLSDGQDFSVATVMMTVTGAEPPSSHVLLTVDRNEDAAFAYEPATTLLDTSALDSNNGDSRGLAAAEDGSQYWVVDVDRNVYRYTADGTLQGQWQFSGVIAPEGIAVSGTDVWIVSKQTDEVYFFAGGADFSEGAHAPTSSFPLAAENGTPTGLTSDGSSIWVTNDSSGLWRVFKYEISGTLLGSWDLDPANRNARGIAIDVANPHDMLVVNDGSTDSVFRYPNSTTVTSGSLSASEITTLDATNSSPQGIAIFEMSINNVPVGPLSDIDPANNTVLVSALAIGAATGVTLEAIEENAVETVSYSLLDDAAGRLTVEPQTGLVTIATDDLALFMAGESLSAIGVATSSDGSSSQLNFTVGIVADENPVAPGLLVPNQNTAAILNYDEQGNLASQAALTNANDKPRGIATSADGAKRWVVDLDGSVYVYDNESNLIAEWQAAEAPGAEGITVSGDDVWIVSRRFRRIYFYAGGANFISGEQTATSSFALANENARPYGLTTNGTDLWVANDSSNQWRMFRYDLQGILLGSWNLDAANRNARGVALDPADPNDILVVNDGANEVVFRYTDAADATTGDFTATDILLLDAANQSPQGIALFGDALQAFTLTSRSEIVTEPHIADFDTDGDIDGSDFLHWQREFFGDQEDEDLTVWQDNYGTAQAALSESTSAAPASHADLSLSAELVDTVLGLQWPETQDDGEFSFVRQDLPALPLDQTVAINSPSLPTAIIAIDSTEIAAVDKQKPSADQLPWLAEDLLEAVFG